MLYLFFAISIALHTTQIFCKTILFDVVGDAYSSGRIIQESFERGITLAYAEAVQKRCAQFNSDLSISIVNPAGSQYTQLEKAHKINCMHADLVISIHCYQEQISPSLYIYHYGYEPLPTLNTNSLIWCPYNKAYTINFSKTQIYALELTHTLKSYETDVSFYVHGPFIIPLTPLVGIVTPALLLELGLITEKNWHNFVGIFADALLKLAIKI